MSQETGRIVSQEYGHMNGTSLDMKGRIVAPGYLDLHTNGMNGIHFSYFTTSELYPQGLTNGSKFLVIKGVTVFWATLPSVPEALYLNVIRSKFNEDHIEA